MGQNTSPAVMQQRHEPHDSLDYFPTPPWATRALCERLMVLSPVHEHLVWEPACGEGHMAKPLSEIFNEVYASDLHDYGDSFPAQDDVCDFLTVWDHPLPFQTDHPDWIITNPPFRLAEEFIKTALSRASIGCAVFIRTSFLEGKARHRRLFSYVPPALILQFAERVPLVKGRLDKAASTATSYCWIVWLKAKKNGTAPGTAFEWIAPCRARLERACDYPVPDADLAALPLFDASDAETSPVSQKGGA